jgi:hypothetical protein
MPQPNANHPTDGHAGERAENPEYERFHGKISTGVTRILQWRAVFHCDFTHGFHVRVFT